MDLETFLRNKAKAMVLELCLTIGLLFAVSWIKRWLSRR